MAARVADMSLGTVRTLVMVRGFRNIATCLAFFEVIIWLLVARRVLREDAAWWELLAYAAGFAAGIWLGSRFEGRLALGNEFVRIVSWEQGPKLAALLRDAGHRVIELQGRMENERPIDILQLVVPRRELPALLSLVRSSDPSAFYTTSDVKSIHLGQNPHPPEDHR
ncbi:MAG: hypothetical protein RL095_516 [Verrucomicrobiota bacterium]